MWTKVVYPKNYFQKKNYKYEILNHLYFGPSFVFSGIALGRYSQRFFKIFLSLVNHGGQHCYSAPLHPPPPGHKKAFYGHAEYRGKNALLKINLCGNKDKSFKSKGHQELCRMTLLGSHRTVHLDLPYSRSIFL